MLQCQKKTAKHPAPGQCPAVHNQARTKTMALRKLAKAILFMYESRIAAQEGRRRSKEELWADQQRSDGMGWFGLTDLQPSDRTRHHFRPQSVKRNAASLV
eukprot:TRINITY_DN779_c0_g1_i7.p3 TRINITY_DN779_c0_g1~~TRINITY_DN779_c0_g1_i7.p3  ORF type:complete len:101 (-),score=4.33 TRINITY_DN779_c0_g1_i7:254-556(-)